jgi:hypothetical protein
VTKIEKRSKVIDMDFEKIPELYREDIKKAVNLLKTRDARRFICLAP